MDPATSYFLKKYYPHVIKWWLVVYNPEAFRIWPSKAEEEQALREEALQEEALQKETSHKENLPAVGTPYISANASAYNATTGSYSGLYGQKPVDADTQAALDAIMNTSNNQNNVDFLLSGGSPSKGAAYAINNTSSSSDVITPSDQDEIIKEANAIYERLLKEAEEDEAKKQAEIEAARAAAQGTSK
jgi:hypothetical protein